MNPCTLVTTLIDFGSAKVITPGQENVAYCQSRYYRSPELIFGNKFYDVTIDMWSVGCILSELLLGAVFFPGASGIDQLVEIIKVLGTPTRAQIQAMNANYKDHKFPQIKPVSLPKVSPSDFAGALPPLRGAAATCYRR